jgi:tRNA threonylcarbamoyl adenosine modification protein YeaZ
LAVVLVLAFDTATSAVTVALYEWAPGDEPCVLASLQCVDRQRHAEVLSPSIATVLGAAGATPGDLGVISVGVGPGPYTGLRVGLVTARALGSALKIPVHGVCTLDAIAWATGDAEPFVVATDARRKEVYWAEYESSAVRTSEPHVGPPADAAAVGLPVYGEGALLYPEALPGTPWLPSAEAIAELTLVRLSGGHGLPLLQPDPLYLRRPDAKEIGPRKKAIQ